MVLLERERCLERFYGRRPSDGDFLVGVVTTGIYCLPSCRARKPRPENVRIFAGESEARRAGLRPCRRCRPEHFYARVDPERELVYALAERVRTDPARFRDTSELARAGGVGATKLHALFRRHFQTTPAAFLLRARVRRAMRLLTRERASVLDAALGSGCESPSSFHENFRRMSGTSPGAYRSLGEGPELVLGLPRGFRPQALLALFARDARGRCERARAGGAAKALVLDGSPARLELSFEGEELRARIESSRPPSRAAWIQAHGYLARWLGLEQDPAAFERRAARSAAIARLVRGSEGLRVPLTTDAFEGLVWVIVGAQVNTAFASACRGELIELAGTPCGDGFFAHPTPEQVARLEPPDLERLRFSRRKAEYLLDAARAIARGELELEDLAGQPAGVAQERLAAVRGLGPWSVQYLLMRAYGFEDCAPAGDSALALALQRFFALDARPDPEETRSLLEPFAPHRSLATYHLWRTLSS